MKNIIKDRDDIVFYIKMYPLRSHPDAYKKSKAIVCSKSIKLLDDAFAGKTLPEPSCETSEVDENIKLAEELGVTATPTIILPDGAIVPGYKDADALVALIEQAGESMAQENSGDEEGEPSESMGDASGESMSEESPAEMEESHEETEESPAEVEETPAEAEEAPAKSEEAQ